MGDIIDFLQNPVVALFVSIALGNVLGKLRVGPVQLGGVCGTLFVALLIGQLGVVISEDLKNTAFALFIFALGFTAGPQFFVNIRSGWRYGIFSLIEVVSVLVLVGIAAVAFGFDAGTSAGLFAGAATESAVLGTAADAINGLGLSTEAADRLEANLATAYSVTYVFGLVSIIVFVTQIAPLLLKVDLAEEARRIGNNMGVGEESETEPGLPALVGRAFRPGPLAGATVGSFEDSRHNQLTIDRIKRGTQIIVTDRATAIQPDDILFVLGRRNAVIAAQDHFGDEVPIPPTINIPAASLEVVLTRKEAFGLDVRQLKQAADTDMQRGVFISSIRRLDHSIPVLPATTLQKGDVLTLFGSETAIIRAAAQLGHVLPKADRTDFIFLATGVVAGFLIGGLSYRIGALDLTLGMGGGALVSGLVFGWLHMHFPRYGSLPGPAAEFMKEFGLAAFIAAVGLSAGPDALHLIAQYGLQLPVLGVLVSVVPALVSLFVGRKLLKIEAPILLGAIAGQHCSTPTITALVSQSRSGIPVIGYTVTYAISNVLLPLMGPVVVGLVQALQ